jgi:hypothetical protein
MVTVCEIKMVSPQLGFLPQLQVPAADQFPLATELQLVAVLELANCRRNMERNRLSKNLFTQVFIFEMAV